MTVISRRGFLFASTAAGGALVIGINPTAAAEAGLPQPAGAWIQIAPDNTVTLMAPVADLGQNVYTTLPKYLAEELELDWDAVVVEQALGADVYGNPGMMEGMQAVGDSRSTRGYFESMRQIGASAREVLRAAAAKDLGVPVEEIRAEAGMLHHDASGKSLAYGDVLATAATLDLPAEVALKPQSEWKILGKSGLARKDIDGKVRGEPMFGMDVRVPGMRMAAIAHAPAVDGRLDAVDEAPALAIDGVDAVVKLDHAVAVVAKDYWTAKRGLDALSPSWIDPSQGDLTTETVMASIRMDAREADFPVENEGDVEAAFAAAKAVIEVEYEAPFLAHMTMEPQNATVDVRDGEIEVWAPTQTQSRTREKLAKIYGLSQDDIIVHTTFLGGGFGRRAYTDQIEEAAAISAQVGGPVQLVFSRESDLRMDYFRPGAVSFFKAAVDQDGNPSALYSRMSNAPLFKRLDPVRWGRVPLDFSIPGYISNFALDYPVPNRKLLGKENQLPIRVGTWRSVSGSQTAYFREALMDELAVAAGEDPLAWRKRQLAAKPRIVRALQRVEDMSGWGRELPDGSGLGVACFQGFGSLAAVVIEARLENDSDLHVDGVWAAVDLGIAIDPQTITAQMEGGILEALQAAVRGQVTFADGGVVETNFDGYRWINMWDVPKMEVAIIAEGDAPIGGVGEVGVPGVAPALCNAIFAATGKRIRSLPLNKHGIELA